jgi:AcrR family transcriptional regulator
MVPTAKTSTNRPPRRAPLPKALIDEYKRERCALALGELVHEVGVGGLTVTLTTKRARMARNTFYGLFKNQEAALQYAYELGDRRLREAVESSVDGEIEEAVEALLAAAEKEPYLIGLCLVHGGGRATPRTGPYDQTLVEVMAAALGEAGERSRGGRGDSAVGELLALGILSLIAACLRRGETHSLTALSGPLAKFVRIQLGVPQSVVSSQASALGSG